MRPDKASLIYSLPFFVLFLFFFWPLICLKKSFITGDFSVQHLPWAFHYFESIKNGQLPYWVSGMTCGFPLVAEGQVAVFYWLNILSYRFLPFIAAYTWSIPFHLLVGGVSMFFYARALKLSVPASWVAAICFAFGSGYAGCFANTASLRTLCWLPLALVVCEKIRLAPVSFKMWGIVGLSILFSQQWTAGFSQLALYSFLYCLIHELLAGGKKVFSTLWPVLFSLALGTVIALPQLLETFQLIRESTRQGESIYFALWGSVPPIAPISLIFPEWGNVLRFSFYLGVLPLCLILALCFFHQNQKAVLRHAVLAGLFFLLALGKFNPLYVWAIEALHLTSLRIPAKFLFFTLTSLSVLAGFGLDRLLLAVQRRENYKWYQRMLTGLAGSVILLPLVPQLLLKLAESFLPRFNQWYVQRLILEKGAGAKPAEYYQGLLAHFFQSLETTLSYSRIFNLNAILLTGVSAILLLVFLKGRLRKGLFIFLTFTILVCDLAVFGHFLSTGFIGNSAELKKLKPSAAVMKISAAMHGKEGSLVEFVSARDKEALPPNASLYYGISHAGGYSPLLLKHYYELTQDLGIVDSSLGRPECSFEVWERQRGLLDLIGARFIHSDKALDLRDLKLLSQARNFFLYENQTVLPRVAGFYEWQALEMSENRLDFLKSEKFGASQKVVLDKPLDGVAQHPGAVYTQGEVFEESSEKIRSKINMRHEGVVMVRLSAYPGWKLKVDGRQTQWFVVNHAFIGFVVPEGEHHIELFYEPALKTLFH